MLQMPAHRSILLVLMFINYAHGTPCKKVLANIEALRAARRGVHAVEIKLPDEDPRTFFVMPIEADVVESGAPATIQLRDEHGSIHSLAVHDDSYILRAGRIAVRPDLPDTLRIVSEKIRAVGSAGKGDQELSVTYSVDGQLVTSVGTPLDFGSRNDVEYRKQLPYAEARSLPAKDNPVRTTDKSNVLRLMTLDGRELLIDVAAIKVDSISMVDSPGMARKNAAIATLRKVFEHAVVDQQAVPNAPDHVAYTFANRQTVIFADGGKLQFVDVRANAILVRGTSEDGTTPVFVRIFSGPTLGLPNVALDTTHVQIFRPGDRLTLDVDRIMKAQPEAFLGLNTDHGAVPNIKLTFATVGEDGRMKLNTSGDAGVVPSWFAKMLGDHAELINFFLNECQVVPVR